MIHYGIGDGCLCAKCENGLVYERATGVQRQFCNVLMKPIEVPPDISRCTDFRDKNTPTRHDMEKIAWVVTRKPHWHRKTTYGITESEFEAAFKGQDGRCAICCRQHIPGRATGLVVDHDHASKRFRGLLCQSCNRAIGLLAESADVLRRAAEYIEQRAGHGKIVKERR